MLRARTTPRLMNCCKILGVPFLAMALFFASAEVPLYAQEDGAVGDDGVPDSSSATGDAGEDVPSYDLIDLIFNAPPPKTYEESEGEASDLQPAAAPSVPSYDLGDIFFGDDPDPGDGPPAPAAVDLEAEQVIEEAEPQLPDDEAVSDEPDVARETPPQYELPEPRDDAETLVLPRYSTTTTSPEVPAEEEAAPAAGEGLQGLETSNPVVAVVEGEEIRWLEVIDSAGDLPLEREDQLESLFPALLDRLIDLKLLALAADHSGLRDDPSIREQVERYEENLIREKFLLEEVAAAVTEEDIHKRYDRLVKAVGSNQQIHARHILLESEKGAEQIIAALDRGENFALLANKFSIGPSATRGGDLGYFDPGRMVPEFAQAALSMEVGAYSREPVKTPFGWHVIQLMDHRIEGIPPYGELEETLREQLRQEAVDSILAGLRRDASLEIFPATISSPPVAAFDDTSDGEDSLEEVSSDGNSDPAEPQEDLSEDPAGDGSDKPASDRANELIPLLPKIE